MRAFVFSGGANRGALQAGAALALFEAGISPELIVGSSAGALNGMVIACDPTLEGVRCMAERWRTLQCEEVFPGNRAHSMLRVVRGRGSFHSNKALRRSILSLLPPNVRRFGDLAIPLIVTATSYATGDMRLFGLDPQERILDGVMASCAVPPYLPPYQYRGEWYLDGGFVANLPISVALQYGATEIWAMEIGTDLHHTMSPFGMISTVNRTFEAMMRRQMAHEREIVRLAQHAGVHVHHIQMLHYSNIDVHDFSHSSTLIELGKQTAERYLREGTTSQSVASPKPASLRQQAVAAFNTLAAVQTNLARMRVQAFTNLWRHRKETEQVVDEGIG